MPAGKVVAIAVGLVGVVLVSVSGIGLAAASQGHCDWKVGYGANHTAMIITNSTTNITSVNTATLKVWQCTPFTHVELATSLLALIGGSFMWSVSSGTSSYNPVKIFCLIRQHSS